jgi:hypothetical protein
MTALNDAIVFAPSVSSEAKKWRLHSGIAFRFNYRQRSLKSLRLPRRISHYCMSKSTSYNKTAQGEKMPEDQVIVVLREVAS